MNLNQIRAFVAVLDYGSLSSAGAHLGMSTANLSDHIQRLEQSHGVVLFSRSARGMRPTHAGTQFSQHARKLLETVLSAEASLSNIGSVQAGTHAVGMSRNGGYCFIRRMVQMFREDNPTSQLRFLGRNSYHVADLVRRGELELGFVVLPVNSEGLNVVALFDDEVVVAGTQHATKGLGSEITLEQLSGLDVVLYDVEEGIRDPTRRQLEARLQHNSLALTPVIEVQYLENAFEIVHGAGGVMLVASQVLRALDPLDSMTRISLAEPLRETTAMVYRTGASISPRVSVFADFASRVVDQLVLENSHIRKL